MGLHSFVLIFVTIIMFHTTVFADCKSIQNGFEFYECALRNHPQQKAAVISEGLAAAYEDRARQLPNPELSVKSVSGKNSGENMGGTELGVSISMTDLVIQRSANIDLGRAERKVARIEFDERSFNAKAQVIKDLYRYRQVLEELELITEALGAYRKIESQFTSRRARGPEQEVSLSLVQLAQSDYELNRNHLSVEQDEILSRFKGFLGENFELKKELLPLPKTNWPEVKDSALAEPTLELRKIEAEKDRLAAEKSKAAVASWPKIAVGPTMERNTEGANSFYTYGFNMTVDLPLLSLNGGGRDIANRAAEIAKLEYQYSANQEKLRKQRLVQVYRTSIESLKRSVSGTDLVRKHRQIDNLFKSGLASGTTIIEAHRQLTEFSISKHEHEILALEALMQIRFLQKQDISEVMQ